LANKSEIEEGLSFAPQFGADGLITAVATDAKSGDVLMVAHMNAEALRKTIESGEAWYYSRSRKAEQDGPGACHTGRRSCFYRAVPLGQSGAVTLELRSADKTFDPPAVYGGAAGKPRR
jgi:phosphoribosyl-AMP cyclohydrolase